MRSLVISRPQTQQSNYRRGSRGRQNSYVEKLNIEEKFDTQEADDFDNLLDQINIQVSLS